MILTVAKISIPLALILIWGVLDRTKRLAKLFKQHPNLMAVAYGEPGMSEEDILAEMINRYAFKIFTGYSTIDLLERAFNISERVNNGK